MQAISQKSLKLRLLKIAEPSIRPVPKKLSGKSFSGFA